MHISWGWPRLSLTNIGIIKYYRQKWFLRKSVTSDQGTLIYTLFITHILIQTRGNSQQVFQILYKGPATFPASQWVPKLRAGQTLQASQRGLLGQTLRSIFYQIKVRRPNLKTSLLSTLGHKTMIAGNVLCPYHGLNSSQGELLIKIYFIQIC